MVGFFVRLGTKKIKCTGCSGSGKQQAVAPKEKGKAKAKKARTSTDKMRIVRAPLPSAASRSWSSEDVWKRMPESLKSYRRIESPRLIPTLAEQVQLARSPDTRARLRRKLIKSRALALGVYKRKHDDTDS